jgi:NAD(P)H-hydrate epimerase
VNAQRWQASGGAVAPFGPAALDGACLIVDALFGAGLRRPLTPEVRAVIDRINRSGVPCVAVDIPSGVLGDSGEVLGGGDDGAPVCAATVTFFRPKPGHLLYPGRALCGALTVADIGIPARVLTQIKPATVQNTPLLWRLPRPGWGDHKYTRGHGVIFGGARMTGAARLAARAARRVGAGLVTLAVPDSAVPVYAGAELGALVERRAEGALGGTLADPRRNGVLIGPGAGIGSETRGLVAEILESGLPVVLDADALTSYADRPDDLFGRISGRDGATVLTPHGGEFQRLFPDLGQGGKLTRARAAAARAGATVVLKGADTVVAMPDGRAAIATNAPPWLATGGTGDVLAGLILGLLVQGTDAWTAATAGVWLQGAAAGAVGRGLIAEDLPDVLPRVLNAL